MARLWAGVAVSAVVVAGLAGPASPAPGKAGYTSSQGASKARVLAGAEIPRERSDAVVSRVGALDRVSTRSDGPTTYTLFEQTVAGFPVLGGEVKITDGPGAAGDFVFDARKRGIRPPSKATVSSARAIALARRAVGVLRLQRELGLPGQAGPVVAPTARLAIDPTAPGGRLVWQVIVDSAEPRGNFEVLVDAHDGAILAKRDRLARADGLAYVYDPDPVKEQNSFTGLYDKFDADSAQLTALLRAKPLTDLILGPDPYGNSGCLYGAYAWGLVGEPNTPARDVRFDVCNPSLDFRTVRSDDTFEAVMAYFHVTRTVRYLSGLGLGGFTYASIPLIANGIRDDNSDFDPTVKNIEFGTGGVDDGEEGEVIVHELGHAIQDRQAGNGFDQSLTGIGEGFGDYLAATVSARFSGESRAFAACWSPWDNLGSPAEGYPQITRGSCERRVDSKRSAFAQFLRCGGFEVHCEGQVWSGALWALRGRLGAGVIDRDLVASQFSYLRTGTGFYEATQAFLRADQRLFRGRHRRVIANLFGVRDLLREPDGSPLLSERYRIGRRIADYAARGGGQRPLLITRDDVYNVRLRRHKRIRISLHGPRGVWLYLYGPGVRSVATTHGVVASGKRRLTYTPRRSGRYFLDVYAKRGRGVYHLSSRHLHRR